MQLISYLSPPHSRHLSRVSLLLFSIKIHKSFGGNLSLTALNLTHKLNTIRFLPYWTPYSTTYTLSHTHLRDTHDQTQPPKYCTCIPCHTSSSVRSPTLLTPCPQHTMSHPYSRPNGVPLSLPRLLVTNSVTQIQSLTLYPSTHFPSCHNLPFQR